MAQHSRRETSILSWLRLAVCAGVSVGLLACLSTGNDDDDVGVAGGTSWFSSCAEDTDCQSGECLCGVCTTACVRDSQCTELRSTAHCLDTEAISECGGDVSGNICSYDGEQLANPSAGSDDEGDDEPSSSSAPSDGTTDDAPDVDPTPNPDQNQPSFDGAPTKVDLLFMLDNSISMADKHALFAETIPDLVAQLTSPPCVADVRVVATPQSAAEECPQGSSRQFAAVQDIHVGIITSSLGGHGAVADCVQSTAQHSEQAVDMAHLLGSLPRGASVAPGAADGFLAWTESTRPDGFATEFANLVRAAGEFGCNWEASLESWYRFLIDPYPYTQVVRQPCNISDTNNLCVGPETDGAGNLLVDSVILNQRAQFLRPDSLVAIVMLSDENDCSFKASGQVWRLTQTLNPDGGFNPAFRGTAACDDPAFGPTHECCHSCGAAAPPPNGCPSATNAEGATVGVGCELSRRWASDGVDDHPNLRCFQQRRRFGVDYLYPVERYSTALSSRLLCPFSDTLDPNDASACPGGSGVVDNPLYSDLRLAPGDPANLDATVRPKSWVFLAGIVGVPWQDLAENPGTASLVYRSNSNEADTDEAINWQWLIGTRDPASGIPAPEDPLMVESVAPRAGTNPATGEELSAPSSGYLANSINGHEWDIADKSDLQYACIFPLGGEGKQCLTQEAFRTRRDEGEAVPWCDCTDFGKDLFRSPLCQAPDGSYGLTQRFDKAYPSLRQLQVLHDFGNNSIVASICARSINPEDVNYGYRPAVRAMISRFAEVLAR